MQAHGSSAAVALASLRCLCSLASTELCQGACRAVVPAAAAALAQHVDALGIAYAGLQYLGRVLERTAEPEQFAHALPLVQQIALVSVWACLHRF